MLGLKVKYEAVQKCKLDFNTFKDLIRVFYITEKSYLLFLYLDLCKKYTWIIKPNQKHYTQKFFLKQYQCTNSAIVLARTAGIVSF